VTVAYYSKIWTTRNKGLCNWACV